MVTNKKRTLDIIIIIILLIFFGIGEVSVVTIDAFKNKFDLTSLLAIKLGLLYILAGIFVLIRLKISFLISESLLLSNIIIRIMMLITKLYPTNTSIEIFGFVVGISFVLFFFIYLIIRRKVL